MKNIFTVAVLTLGMVVAGSAMASGPLSYDYVQATAVHSHDTWPSNGLNAKVSVDLSDGLFVQGDATRFQSHGTQFDRYQAGLGYHYSVSDTVSVYGLASAVSVDSNIKGSDAKYGFDGEVGARFAVTPSWEVGAAVETQKLNLDSGVRHQVQTFGKLSTSYFFAKDWAVVADYRASKVDHQVGAGVRYTW